MCMTTDDYNYIVNNLEIEDDDFLMMCIIANMWGKRTPMQEAIVEALNNKFMPVKQKLLAKYEILARRILNEKYSKELMREV